MVAEIKCAFGQWYVFPHGGIQSGIAVASKRAAEEFCRLRGWYVVPMAEIKPTYHLETVCTSIYDKQLKKAIHVWPKKDKMLLGVDSSDKTVIAVELDKQGVGMLISALQGEKFDEEDKETRLRLHNDNLQLRAAINAILKWADGESKDISTFIKLCVRRYLWGIKL